jgi:hypothetical protein
MTSSTELDEGNIAQLNAGKVNDYALTDAAVDSPSQRLRRGIRTSGRLVLPEANVRRNQLPRVRLMTGLLAAMTYLAAPAHRESRRG